MTNKLSVASAASITTAAPPKRSGKLASVTITANKSPKVSTNIKRLRRNEAVFHHRNRTLPPFFGGFHRLTIDDARRRVVYFLQAFTNLVSYFSVDFLPYPQALPMPKVVIDSLPRW